MSEVLCRIGSFEIQVVSYRADISSSSTLAGIDDILEDTILGIAIGYLVRGEVFCIVLLQLRRQASTPLRDSQKGQEVLVIRSFVPKCCQLVSNSAHPHL